MLESSMVIFGTDEQRANEGAEKDQRTEREPRRSEDETLRSACGLLDRSERGKLALTGPSAVEFLNGQITNELADLRPGEGRYAAFLTNKGKMLGDLRVLAVGEGGAVEELLLDTERVALQALFDMIRRYKVGYDVELHKRTLECSLFSLIGPAARACVTRACGARAAGGDKADAPSAAQIDSLQSEHDHVPATVEGRQVRLIATSDGIDVLCASADYDAVQTALLEAGASTVGEGAVEILRVEHGRPRYGVDMDDGTIPQEAGINERAVNFTKGCYVGQETVARLFYRGKPNRHLRGLLISDPPSQPVAGTELRLDERVVGHLSSIVTSPTHGTIGLALVRREAGPGDALAVGEHGVSATVVELPFAGRDERR
ncbi:MAG TPA: glycine cleavage T C-terminal barrel domain-containing protein [Solirubrobacteraceae bacterium]|jgi:folate-binding protein YgfZ